MLHAMTLLGFCEAYLDLQSTQQQWLLDILLWHKGHDVWYFRGPSTADAAATCLVRGQVVRALN